MKTEHFKYFSVLFPELTVYCKIYLNWMFGYLSFWLFYQKQNLSFWLLAEWGLETSWLLNNVHRRRSTVQNSRQNHKPFTFTLGYFPGESKRKKGHKVNYMQIWKPGVHSCRVSTEKNPHAQPWHWIHSVLVSCL